MFKKDALTFDDIQIIPKLSNIKHRTYCRIETKISKRYTIQSPIVSAPMDTVTEWQMAQKLWELGGIGFIHRFMSIEDQCEQVKKANDWHIAFGKSTAVGPVVCVGAAIGVTNNYDKRAEALIDAGVKILLIDVAHGHHLLVQDALSKLKSAIIHQRVDIIAGNISTADAAKDLIKWGADGLRVGVGNGSLCETRIRTGVGIPQVTALMDIVKIAKNNGIPVIADGGIRTPGDVAKALALGADTVMLGSLFAGTKESPGDRVQIGNFPNEKLYKQYRGSASQSAKLERGETNNIEGNSMLLPYKGKAKRIFTVLVDGIKSSMSYVGAWDLESFYKNAKFVRVTTNGVIESHPHLMKEN